MNAPAAAPAVVPAVAPAHAPLFAGHLVAGLALLGLTYLLLKRSGIIGKKKTT